MYSETPQCIVAEVDRSALAEMQELFKNHANGFQVLNTWSEIVNFTAVTTVVLINGDGEFRDRFNLGSKFDGSIKVNLPKHSATTFLVPSSWHSQWQ